MNVVEEIYARNPGRPRVPYRRKRETLSLIRSLERHRTESYPGIIAEYKRKSPSGFMKQDSGTPVEYFDQLTGRNIAGFSVLTEPDHFLGSYQDITSSAGFNIPILDKDFISSPEMIEDAYNAGADAILLILDFLEQDTIYDLAEHAASLGMESLVEFHDLSHLETLKTRRGIIFGYNRRNLRTLRMEPEEERVLELLSGSGPGIVLESGIDSEYLKKHDVSRFAGMLIGASILDGDPVFDTMDHIKQ